MALLNALRIKSILSQGPTTLFTTLELPPSYQGIAADTHGPGVETFAPPVPTFKFPLAST